MATTEGVYLDGLLWVDPILLFWMSLIWKAWEIFSWTSRYVIWPNTISGVINLITIKPKPGRSGSVRVESGNSGHRQIKATTNFQLTDKIYQRYH
ncbi:MAG: hypothetical protein CM1200mP10_27590 [Candidatus Neomarinimicrobiota bacterium]|nr:MAG: hypothetical protein CM1200mP10_27590 [Candidatus Neomarinimicrobiota bacterium]